MTKGRAEPIRPVTLDQVAEVAGVSRATVSRVVNEVPTVDPQLRRIVEEAVAATGYVPNTAARSLVTRRTGSVALVISEPDGRSIDEPFLSRVFTDPYFGRVTDGAQRVLRPDGIHLVIIPADEPSRDQVVRYVRQGHVDGVLLISSSAADPLPGRISALGVPAVLSARPGRPVPLSYVDVEQENGARLAAAHLLARGCRHPATICGPLDMPASQERLAGFQAALTERGFPPAPTAEADFTRGGGALAARQLLAARPELDALFVANDLMAEGAIGELVASGRRVPHDVAVVGFDDSSAALACRPPLTTVRQPVEDMAAEMARLLLQRLSEPGVRPRAVIFQPTLVIRESA